MSRAKSGKGPFGTLGYDVSSALRILTYARLRRHPPGCRPRRFGRIGGQPGPRTWQPVRCLPDRGHRMRQPAMSWGQGRGCRCPPVNPALRHAHACCAAGRSGPLPPTSTGSGGLKAPAPAPNEPIQWRASLPKARNSSAHWLLPQAHCPVLAAFSFPASALACLCRKTGSHFRETCFR